MSDNYDLLEELCIVGEANWGQAIFRVCAALPRDVCEWVVNNITFIDAYGTTGLAVSVSCFKSKDNPFMADRLVIVLSTPSPEDDNDDRMAFTVAHEIGHHWHGHREAHSYSTYEEHEKAADAKANEWGFPGESNRINRGWCD
ncbi:MAG: ImmA/IrrE family metallo-endopeptidase [Pirellulaceae bacterium]